MKVIKTLALILFTLPAFSQSLDWQVPNVSFMQGDTVRAEFYAYGFNNITAYQFAMKFDTAALRFVAVTFPASNPMGLTTGSFSWPGKPGYNVKPGELRHLRSMPSGQTYAAGTHGFTYVLVAKQSGALSQKFTLATCCLSPPLYPLAYRYPLIYTPLTVAYVAASEEQTTAAQDVEVPSFVSVAPNPFQGSTVVTWSLSGAGETEITIVDTAGRLIARQVCQSASGIGSAQIEGLAPGLYLLTLRAGDMARTVKIIAQ